MARVPAVTRDSIPESQRAAFDEVVRQRGIPVGGPASVILNAPEISLRVRGLASYLRSETSLAPRIRELAMLVAARENDCQYIWNAHAAPARAAGLRDDIVNALRDKKDLPGLAPDEAAVVNYGREFFRTRRVSQATFDAALAQFGVLGLTELTNLMGYYSMFAFHVNAFDVELPTEDTMVRVPAVTRESVPESQRAAFDEVVRQRGSIPVEGPAAVILNAPGISLRVRPLDLYLRSETSLAPRIIELGILVTARENDCQYVWFAHAPSARAAGLRDDIVDALRDKKDLPGLAPDEAAVVSYGREFFRTRRVSQATFDAALAQLGVLGLTELTTLMGHYSMLAFHVNAFGVGLPEERTEEALPIERTEEALPI